jgi:hypothetical protein
MCTFKDFMSSPDSAVYVCGVLVKKNKNNKELLLIKQDGVFRPCGKTLRFTSSALTDHYMYIQNLKYLLKSCTNSFGEKIFSNSHVQKIIEHEEFYDKERGSVAPYFRSVISSFVEKIGIYPAQLGFIARTEKKNTALATYMFQIRIGWSPISDGLFNYIDESSLETTCGKYSLSSDHLDILNSYDANVYQGSSKQYKKLYNILNKTF